jgi:hypothetical protein
LLIKSYPFDEYVGNVLLESNSYVGDVKKPLNMSIIMINPLVEWWVKFSYQDNYDGIYTPTLVKLVISRAPTQKFFSVFIVLILWTISLGIFSMSIAHLWYSRKVEAPTIGVVITMLFALPAVRNTQPGVPPIGTTLDGTNYLTQLLVSFGTWA